MSRIAQKYIKFDNTATGTNARVIPANYTPTNYTPTQVSSEGTDKISAHLKGIDDVLVPGSNGDIPETSFSLADNQASAANVTGFAFANASVRAFEALVSVEIDATANLYQSYKLYGIQKDSDWDLGIGNSIGDDSGVLFSITTAGQIQYTSISYAGFSSGTIKFRAISVSK